MPTATVYARLTVGTAFEEIAVVVRSLVSPSQAPCLWMYKVKGGGHPATVALRDLIARASTQ